MKWFAQVLVTVLIACVGVVLFANAMEWFMIAFMV